MNYRWCFVTTILPDEDISHWYILLAPLLGDFVGFMKGRQLATKPFHPSMPQNSLVTFKPRQLRCTSSKGLMGFSM